MTSVFILQLLLGILVILSLLAAISYGFYRLITKRETPNTVNGETNASKPKEPSESALSISAQVETPDNYEYMFDDCPNQTDLIFTAYTRTNTVTLIFDDPSQCICPTCYDEYGCQSYPNPNPPVLTPGKEIIDNRSSIPSTASMSVQECANKCSERSECGAFYSTGCTTSKTCDGSCVLVSKESKNIIPRSDIGRGLCTYYEEGDIKFYRKIA